VPRLDKSARLKVLRKMYSVRFGEDAPERRSVEQLRGMEGARVKRSVSFMRVKMP
jgi:CRISPR-associated protein Cas1